DRPRQAEQIGNDPGREGTDGVAQVAPEAVDAEGPRAPRRMRSVGDCRDQAWIDHGGTKPQQQACQKPPAEIRGERSEEECRCLYPHTADDQAFAAPAIAEWPGDDLQHAPDRRIDGLEDTDALDAKPVGREKKRKYAPAHAVIEVVHEPGLRCCEQVAVAPAG